MAANVPDEMRTLYEICTAFATVRPPEFRGNSQNFRVFFHGKGNQASVVFYCDDPRAKLFTVTLISRTGEQMRRPGTLHINDRKNLHQYLNVRTDFFAPR